MVDARLESGRTAIGSRIRVEAGGRSQIDEVRSGGYHISQGDTRVHFGLGTASLASVTVTWPGGAEESFEEVQANTRITVREGERASEDGRPRRSE